MPASPVLKPYWFSKTGVKVVKKVEVAVNYGHIDSEEKDNRWAEKHFSWADDGSDEQVAGCLTFIIFRFQVKIAGFFAEQLGFVFENCRFIGFAEEKKGDNGKKSGLEAN